MNPSPLFITCASHLESLLFHELSQLGIAGCQLASRGVFIPNTEENVFKVNYLSRLASRALMPLIQFSCPNKETLYKQVRKIDWNIFLDETKTFAIDANVSHPQLRHSLYAAQLVKDAICDVIREKKGARPSIDIKHPDIQLNLLVHNQNAVLSFDTSGAPLYRRGWKEISTEATLPETLAAAILTLSGYSSRETLCDPFCGSGTLLIEAACIATQTPAGFFRKHWGFFHLPSFSLENWEKFKQEWDHKRLPLSPNKIIGADSDPQAIGISKTLLEKTGFSSKIPLIHSPISSLKLPHSPTLVITDPPFGKRLETSKALYQEFGTFMRTQCPASPFAYLICPSFALVKMSGCRILSERPLFHGGLKLTLFQGAF